MESLEQMRERLSNMDMENRTLKEFLTAKTAMVEKRKREIQQVTVHVLVHVHVHVHVQVHVHLMLLRGGERERERGRVGGGTETETERQRQRKGEGGRERSVQYIRYSQTCLFWMPWYPIALSLFQRFINTHLYCIGTAILCPNNHFVFFRMIISTCKFVVALMYHLIIFITICVTTHNDIPGCSQYKTSYM